MYFGLCVFPSLALRRLHSRLDSVHLPPSSLSLSPRLSLFLSLTQPETLGKPRICSGHTNVPSWHSVRERNRSHNLPPCTFLPRMLSTGLQRAQKTPRYRCSSSSLRSLLATWSFLGSPCNHLCLLQICTCLPRTLQSVCANQGKRQRLRQTYTHANADVLYASIHAPTHANTHTLCQVY